VKISFIYQSNRLSISYELKYSKKKKQVPPQRRF
jgi:hypothetical protein